MIAAHHIVNAIHECLLAFGHRCVGHVLTEQFESVALKSGQHTINFNGTGSFHRIRLHRIRLHRIRFHRMQTSSNQISSNQTSSNRIHRIRIHRMQDSSNADFIESDFIESDFIECQDSSNYA